MMDLAVNSRESLIAFYLNLLKTSGLNARIFVYYNELSIGELCKQLDVLSRERSRYNCVVCAAGINPGCSTRLEVGQNFPHETCNGQLRHGLGLLYKLYFCADKAEMSTNIDH